MTTTPGSCSWRIRPPRLDAEVRVGARLAAVREIWDGRDVATDGKAIAETMAPYSIHIYACAATGGQGCLMLHEDVLMADIDVDQWRHAQELLLRSAKACRGLVVIHARGRVVKFRHSHASDVRGRVDVVEDPPRLARDLYEINRDAVDFVVVMERRTVDDYVTRVEDAWNIEDDIDTHVQRTYAALDYADGIVTPPRPAGETLGLQWKLGVSLDQLRSAVRAFVVPLSTVILGVARRAVVVAGARLRRRPRDHVP